MKKIVSVFIIIALLFTFTACGNSIGAVTPAYSSDIHTKDDIETAIKLAKGLSVSLKAEGKLFGKRNRNISFKSCEDITIKDNRESSV